MEKDSEEGGSREFYSHEEQPGKYFLSVKDGCGRTQEQLTNSWIVRRVWMRTLPHTAQELGVIT